jgi:hypothetical protein
MKSVLDPSFHYTPSYDTDVRKTFERIRLEHEAQARAGIPAAQPEKSNALRLDSRKTG